MSDIFPKFIIEGDCLVLGNVTYHYELIEDKSKVRGGGWYRYSPASKEFIFYGDSHDFGKASMDDVTAAVKNNAVYGRYKRRNYSKDHSFAYDTGTEIIPLTK